MDPALQCMWEAEGAEDAAVRGDVRCCAPVSTTTSTLGAAAAAARAKALAAVPAAGAMHTSSCIAARLLAMALTSVHADNPYAKLAFFVGVEADAVMREQGFEGREFEQCWAGR